MNETVTVQGDQVVVEQTVTSVAYQGTAADIDADIAQIDIDNQADLDAANARVAGRNARKVVLQGYKAKFAV